MVDPHVSEAKRAQVRKRMRELGIRRDDLTEKFILGSGKGGQKVNKTSSCVYLKHGPSGIEVKCGKSRSREMNRFFARRELCEKLAERIAGEKSRKQAEIEKIRRQKRRRTRRQKERMLEEKRRQSERKERRKRVGEEE